MPHSKQTSDQGWFYHAPSKPKPRTSDPVLLPPISQIPGLSNVSHLADEDPCKRMWIRETDSDYTKLAKQGGRQDLLTMMPSKPPSEQAVGYPRCDWFYDSYNDPNPPATLDKPYEFLLPAYMVHEPLKKCELSSCADFDPEQAPFAYDKATVYDRDDGRANDKTVKIGEQRKFGYGVRTEKGATKAIQPHNTAAKNPCKGARKR